MPFYDQISKRLLAADINFESSELARTAILEYMVFERANCLGKKHYSPSPGGFQEQKIRSFFNFSSQLIDKRQGQRAQLTRIKLSDHFTSISPSGKRFSLANNDIKEAIQASTLYRAAGRLDAMSPAALLKLKSKLNQYRDCFGEFNVVGQLQQRIERRVKGLLTPEQINKYNAVIRKESELQAAFYEQELRFNRLYLGLGKKLTELIGKEKMPKYTAIAKAAKSLRDHLIDARKALFAKPTALQLSVFKTLCQDQINKAKKEFANYRQKGAWYSELHPYLQEFLQCCWELVGVIAGLTVIPALLVEAFAPRGYLGTFFEKPATDSLAKLEFFEQGVLGEDGVVDGLGGLIIAGPGGVFS